MMVFRFLSCLALGLLASLPAAAECKLVQAASLPLTQTDTDIGIETLPVEIGGKTVPFALNTGSVVSFVTEAVARTADYKPEALENLVVYGMRYSAGAVIPRMALGGLVGTDQHFVLLKARETLGHAAGVIGLDKIEGYDVELDLAHGKLNLFKPDHCPGQVVYWTDSAAVIPFRVQDDGQINVPMKLDGQTVNVILDTSTATGEIRFAAAHRLFGLHRGDLRQSDDQEFGDYRYPFHALSVGGLTIANPDIGIFDYGDREEICDGKFHTQHREHFAEATYRCLGGGDLRIGLKQLRALRLFISFSEKTLYVTPAEAH